MPSHTDKQRKLHKPLDMMVGLWMIDALTTLCPTITKSNIRIAVSLA